MLSRLVQFFAARSWLTLAVWATALIFGMVAYFSLLPREGFPSVDIPVTVAGGTWFVDDSDRIDQELLVPLTTSLKTADGIDTISTVARDNSFTVVLELDEALTSADGVGLFEAAAAEVGLPDGAMAEARAINASKFLDEFDILVGVLGANSDDPRTLEPAAAEMVPFLSAHPDIEVAEVIELFDRGVNPGTGETVELQARFNQLTSEDATSLEILPSIAVGVIAAEGVDSLAIRDATDEALADAAAAGAPAAGFEAVVAIDQATQIRQQVNSLQTNVVTGIIAVALVALMLISWRASAITGIFIITVIASTFGVLWLMGISISTLSLFGVILALGLFVDDSIVITEAIDAFRDESEGPIGIIGQAIRRVGAASVSGTITTILVFAPMLAISGILGSFIRILPITVMVALAVSLILSLIIIPFASRFVLLSAPKAENPLTRLVERGGDALASLIGRRGSGVLGVGFSVGFMAIGLMVFAPQVGFNIFPPQKDSNFIGVEYTFAPGTTIEEATAITADIGNQAAQALGDDLEQSYTYIGNERGATSQLRLADMGSRPVATDLVTDVLQPIADAETGARVVVSQLSAGPPEALFPFQIQLFGESTETLAVVADEIVAELDGASISRPNGTTFNVVETDIGLLDSVSRSDGRRYIEVRARFDADDVTTTTAETQAFVEDRFDSERLAALGLADDALGFDFGLESDNQESFASMPRAFLIALGLMLILLIIQFRSSLQWLLVFLAIPFSFFGVFGGLLLTGNQISFFVMLGLLGLIGIAVNNTILLTDFANQERDRGADRVTAIRQAMRRRFRPLVATSLTTVAGVLPLALSDPFWEALGFTIIFGLLSSTLLVLVSFPYYYLAIEWIRDHVRTPWRRKAGESGPQDALTTA